MGPPAPQHPSTDPQTPRPAPPEGCQSQIQGPFRGHIGPVMDSAPAAKDTRTFPGTLSVTDRKHWTVSFVRGLKPSPCLLTLTKSDPLAWCSGIGSAPWWCSHRSLAEVPWRIASFFDTTLESAGKRLWWTASETWAG